VTDINKIFKGFFKVGNAELILPVFQYKKTRFVENVDVGYSVRYYNRFGMITAEVE